MSTLNYYNGTAWVNVPDGVAFNYYNGTAWTTPTDANYYNGSAWVSAWKKSDPVVYAFYPISMRSWRPTNDWRPTGSDAIGSYSFGDLYCLMNFASATDFSGSGLTLAQALAIRPTIIDTTLRLSRTNGGYGTINNGGYYIGSNSGGVPDTTAPIISATDRVFIDLTGAGWVQNSYITMAITGNLARGLSLSRMVIGNTLSPVYPGNNDLDYTNINSTLTSNILWVTLDY